MKSATLPVTATNGEPPRGVRPRMSHSASAGDLLRLIVAAIAPSALGTVAEVVAPSLNR
jgi:hypothetical protein